MMTEIIKKLQNYVKQDKTIIKKIIVTSVTRAISAVGTFVFNFVLAKSLGVKDFGIFMLMYTIIVGLGFIIRYGYSNAIIRFGAILFENKKFIQILEVKNKVFKNSFIISFCTCIVLFLLSNLISKYYLKIDDFYVVIIFALSLPFFSYLPLQSSYLKAFKKPQLAPFIEMGLSAFLTGIFVGLLYFINFNVDVKIGAICFLLSSIIMFFIGKIVLEHVITRLKSVINYNNKEDDNSSYNFTEFNKSLYDYFINEFISYLLNFSPILILGILATSNDVGLYSITNSISFVISFILWIFNTVYAADFAVLYKQNNLVGLKKMLIRSIFYMSFISVPLFIVILLFPSNILGLFGNEYKVASYGLIIMAFAQLINVLTGPLNFLLNMTGHQKSLRNIIFMTAILSISTSVILIPYFGFYGAVISTSLSLSIQNILCFKKVKNILSLK